MELNEIRLGNKVSINGKVYTIDAKMMYAFFSGNPDYDISNFEPIPLTEEWLLKFGFEELYDDKVFLKDSFEYRDKKVYFGTSSISVQYVHQLQNLFFSLCGEELQLI